MDKSKVRIPPDVLEGLEAVRLSGKTNMMDVYRVIELALDMGHEETALWVYENSRLYANGLFRGFVEAELDADHPAEQSRLSSPSDGPVHSRYVAQQGASTSEVDEPSDERKPVDTREGGDS